MHAEVSPTTGGPLRWSASIRRATCSICNSRCASRRRTGRLEELAQVTPELPRLLPKLGARDHRRSVSPLFQELYDLKVQTLREDLVRLDQLLSRHNFYDCQTILRLRDPRRKEAPSCLQADMDVDADGSDSDRLPDVSGTSANFKPFTSYHWKKQTSRPSPFLARRRRNCAATKPNSRKKA